MIALHQIAIAAAPLLLSTAYSLLYISREESQEWFQVLKKNKWFPPGWIFPVVWTILYSLMGVALAMWIRQMKKAKKNIASGTIFFISQLFLNFYWSAVFFKQKNPKKALAVVLALNSFIILTMFSFAKNSVNSVKLMVPYLGWTLFATYLNIAIIQNNPEL